MLTLGSLSFSRNNILIHSTVRMKSKCIDLASFSHSRRWYWLPPILNVLFNKFKFIHWSFVKKSSHIIRSSNFYTSVTSNLYNLRIPTVCIRQLFSPRRALPLNGHVWCTLLEGLPVPPSRFILLNYHVSLWEEKKENKHWSLLNSQYPPFLSQCLSHTTADTAFYRS